MISMNDMKKLRRIITESFGVSPSVAGRVIGHYNGSGRGDIVAAMLAGDLSGVGPALAALGVNTSEKGPAATTAASDPGTTNKISTGEKISTEPGAWDDMSTGAGDPGEKISGPEPVTRSARKTARNASRIKEKKTSTQNTIVKDQHGSGAAWGVVATSPAALQTEPGKDQPKHDQLETVAGEIVTDETHDGLPVGVSDMIYSAVDMFCKKHDFENMCKCRQSAWGACCMFIGQTVFKPNRKMLAGPTPKNGGFCYDFKKISQLCDIWVYMCGAFGKAPFISDFANFAGIDKTALYGVGGNYYGGELSPARVQLLQKLREAQEAGLSGLIVDGRQNPTGALAALNHWHGWTQTREIIHTAAGSGPALDDIPKLGQNGPELPRIS